MFVLVADEIGINELRIFLVTCKRECASVYTVELQWLEHLWNHENMFETGVLRANEC